MNKYGVYLRKLDLECGKMMSALAVTKETQMTKLKVLLQRP